MILLVTSGSLLTPMIWLSLSANPHKVLSLFFLYVDDMIITGNDVAGITSLKQSISQHFEMKDLGALNYFLGLEISSNSDGYYHLKPSMLLIF